MPDDDNNLPIPDAAAVLREMQQALAMPLVQKKISGISPTGIQKGPYYKEKFALEIKQVLDAMLADKKNREFRYDDFPGQARQTLRLRIYQSFDYLIDFLDPDKRYAKLKHEIIVRAVKSGVQIVFAERERLIARTIEDDPKTSHFDYKGKVMQFIEEAPIGAKLDLQNISMSEEEMEDIRNLLTPCEGLIWDINPIRIKIIRPDPRLLELKKQQENKQQ